MRSSARLPGDCSVSADGAPRHGTIDVASYNVHRCIGNDGRCDPGRIVDVLMELGCDTIGLQEVDNRAGGGHASMQLDFLAAALRMQAVAGREILRHDGHYGNALLTRCPILAVRRHDLSYVRREPRGALDVDLEMAGRTVRVIVTHLGLRPRERRYQVKRLLPLLEDSDASRDLIVLGDFNEWLPSGRPLRWMHEAFGRSRMEATFPSWRPLFALDRIWTRPMQALHQLEVHRSALARIASDHLPVRARLALA